MPLASLVEAHVGKEDEAQAKIATIYGPTMFQIPDFFFLILYTDPKKILYERIILSIINMVIFNKKIIIKNLRDFINKIVFFSFLFFFCFWISSTIY